MGGFSTPNRPPAPQSSPLFYIYRRIGHPVPLIPLDELPSWLSVDKGDWTDPWRLEDMLPAEYIAAEGETNAIRPNRLTSSNFHTTGSLPAKQSAVLISDQDRKAIFLRPLDTKSKEEIFVDTHCYVPRISGSQLERYPFNNKFIRRMMASRYSEFKPKRRFYDSKSPAQRFYLGRGIYPYLWGMFGEVIVFPDDEPLPLASNTLRLNRKWRNLRNRAVKHWLSGVNTTWGYIEPEYGAEHLLEKVKDIDPILTPGVSLEEVPLRKTISAPEYLATGLMGGRPEGLSESVSLVAGVEFLLRVMEKGGGGR